VLIARAVGSVVSTVKNDNLIGRKLLIVRETTADNELIGKAMVAIDTVGAGTGELVLIAQGSAARQTDLTQNSPVDAVIMAIVDSLEVEGELTFKKGL